MRHLFRFLGRQLDQATWELSDEESHHLSKVLRLSPGDIVEVTNGQGLWAVCEVESIGKNSSRLRTTITPSGEVASYSQSHPNPRIVLCIGALRHGSLDEILASLVELGVDTLHLFHQPGSAKDRLTDKTAARWDRLISQAVKQCKRAWFPQVKIHESLKTMLQDPEITDDSLGLFLSPGGNATLLEALDREAHRQLPKITLVVGGELGLSPDEESQLGQAMFHGVRLGNHILRAVTAAVSATAVTSCYRDRGRSEIVVG